ncbi:bL28 family ribosomal protein, partial [bacterium]|nr:bL28 family ribosomal protein [bacterium]
KRRFLLNLRTVRITLEDGSTQKIKISARELRTLKKDSFFMFRCLNIKKFL